MKSNWDVANIKIAKSDVSVAWVTGAKDDCRANRIRRSRFPIDVRKPWKNHQIKTNYFRLEHVKANMNVLTYQRYMYSKAN